VEAHEWGISFSCILDCHNSLITFLSKIYLWHTSFSKIYQKQSSVIAAFNHIINPVESQLLDVVSILHDIIPLKVQEAISYSSHVIETVAVSGIWREEWHSTSAYKKGQKVSPGVLALVLMYKSSVHHFIQTLKRHMHIMWRLCASTISAAIR
jgi:hypothetical protein